MFPPGRGPPPDPDTTGAGSEYERVGNWVCSIPLKAEDVNGHDHVQWRALYRICEGARDMGGKRLSTRLPMQWGAPQPIAGDAINGGADGMMAMKLAPRGLERLPSPVLRGTVNASSPMSIQYFAEGAYGSTVVPPASSAVRPLTLPL
jgi:hypothetical protein